MEEKAFQQLVGFSVKHYIRSRIKNKEQFYACVNGVLSAYEFLGQCYILTPKQERELKLIFIALNGGKDEEPIK